MTLRDAEKADTTTPLREVIARADLGFWCSSEWEAAALSRADTILEALAFAGLPVELLEAARTGNPTEAMIKAGYNVGEDVDLDDIWRAMCAAAQDQEAGR